MRTAARWTPARCRSGCGGTVFYGERFGTFVLFLVLALGMLGFAMKAVSRWVMGI